MQHMTRNSNPAAAAKLIALCIALLPALATAAQPPAAAVAQFNDYVTRLESRLVSQHISAASFLALPADPQSLARLRSGDPLIEKLTPASAADLPSAMLHDWRGTAFVPGATLAGFLRLMRGFEAYPRIYSPQVLSARTLSHDADRYQISLRVAQKHVITVVMDTDYDVAFSQLDPRHASSLSRSTRVAEIASPGANHERVLSPNESHGFLYRLNTYWSAEEQDGGLYIQIESVSLTRSIPTGLAWAIGPFVESVPRESLEFTLTATRNALK